MVQPLPGRCICHRGRRRVAGSRNRRSPIKTRRVIKWTFIGGLLAIVATAGTLYLLATWTPAEYKPQILTEREKADVRQAIERKFAAVFDAGQLTEEGLLSMEGVEDVRSEQEIVVDEATGERTQVTHTTFNMPITSDELNKWIGSMPAVTLNRLAASGVSRPAIAIGKDRITFYANVAKYDKVVGLDLGFQFDDEGAVSIDVQSSSVGRLPIPDEALARYKTKVAQKAKSDIEGLSRTAAKAAGDEMGETASTVVRSLGPKIGSALAGRPVTLDIGQADGNVRIRGIKMVKGKITLDLVADQQQSLGTDIAIGDVTQASHLAASALQEEPDRASVDQARQLVERGR